MALGILNNISAIYAQNSLGQTQASLQKVLNQLSSGSRINSGADDAAGLSLANGLYASSTALSQSARNASQGVDMLQIADGALSQVTSLLNRAVTLATQASTGTLNASQGNAADAEYQKILSEIGTIGSNTEYNGIASFSNAKVSTIALANSGATITATIPPADMLSGSVTISCTVPGSGGTPSVVNFTAAGNGSSISSSVITAGDTLSGSLVINSSGGTAGDSYTLNLAGYQGLASSVAATASAAATQLATDLTAAIGGTTGSTYSGSITAGGVLTISTSQVPALNPLRHHIGWNMWNPLGSGNLTTGDTLGGPLTLTWGGTSYTVNMGNYQGLMSSNTAQVNAALVNLGNEITTGMGGVTGSTYTATIVSGQLSILGSIPAQELDAYAAGHNSNVWQTTPGPDDVFVNEVPMGGPGVGETVIAVGAVPVGATVGGFLNFSDQAAFGQPVATASVDLSGYAGIFSATPDAAKLAQLQTAINSALSPVTGYGYTLAVIPNPGWNWTATGYSLQITSLGTDSNERFRDNGSTLTETPNLVGEALAVGGGSNVNESVGGTAPVITPTNVNLSGVTTANLQTSLLAQLGGAGGNYTVAYDTTSGALSIGISATGTTNGITSVASNANTSQQTSPGGSSTSVFTSDGAISSSYDVTAGTLTTASVGTTNGGAGEDLSATGLTSNANAQAALTKINIAINDVAFQRGQVGANINTLAAVQNVMTSQSTNTLAAENDVTATDYGQATSNMSKFQILSQTGIAALSQANQAQQLITKLLQ